MKHALISFDVLQDQSFDMNCDKCLNKFFFFCILYFVFFFFFLRKILERPNYEKNRRRKKGRPLPQEWLIEKQVFDESSERDS
jgi:hypothetical protein